MEDQEEILLGLAGLSGTDIAALTPGAKKIVGKAVQNTARTQSYTREQKATIAQLPKGIKNSDTAKEISDGKREFVEKTYFVRKAIGVAPTSIVPLYKGNEKDEDGITNIESGQINHPFSLQTVEFNAVVALTATLVAAADYGKGIAGVAFTPLRNAILKIKQSERLVIELPLSYFDLTSTSQDMRTFQYRLSKPRLLDPGDGKISMFLHFGAHVSTGTAGSDVFVEVLMGGEELAPRA